MGKFKEIYIDYLNTGKLPKNNVETIDYSKYTNEMISDFINGKAIKIKLSDYIKRSRKRIFLFAPLDGKVHLWDWTNFREEVSGRLLSYKTDNNLILFQIIEIDKNIPLSFELLQKYNLKVIKRFK